MKRSRIWGEGGYTLWRGGFSCGKLRHCRAALFASFRLRSAVVEVQEFVDEGVQSGDAHRGVLNAVEFVSPSSLHSFRPLCSGDFGGRTESAMPVCRQAASDLAMNSDPLKTWTASTFKGASSAILLRKRSPLGAAAFAAAISALQPERWPIPVMSLTIRTGRRANGKAVGLNRGVSEWNRISRTDKGLTRALTPGTGPGGDAVVFHSQDRPESVGRALRLATASAAANTSAAIHTTAGGLSPNSSAPHAIPENSATNVAKFTNTPPVTLIR